MRNSPSTEQRQQIETRANGLCEYCKSPVFYAVQSFECEHIVPVSLDGTTTMDNLAFSCGGCNRHKSVRIAGIDPDSGQPVSLFHPRQQLWLDHFIWNETFTHVIGTTATGRATIHALQINRPGVVNLRRVLLTVGEHP